MNEKTPEYKKAVRELAIKQNDLNNEISDMAVITLDLDDPEEFWNDIDKLATQFAKDGR